MPLKETHVSLKGYTKIQAKKTYCFLANNLIIYIMKRTLSSLSSKSTDSTNNMLLVKPKKGILFRSIKVIYSISN